MHDLKLGPTSYGFIPVGPGLPPTVDSFVRGLTINDGRLYVTTRERGVVDVGPIGSKITSLFQSENGEFLISYDDGQVHNIGIVTFPHAGMTEQEVRLIASGVTADAVEQMSVDSPLNNVPDLRLWLDNGLI